MELLISLIIMVIVFGILLLGPAWLIVKKNEKIKIEQNKKPIKNFRCGYTIYDQCKSKLNKCCANLNLSWPFSRITFYDDFIIIKNIAKTIILQYDDIKDAKAQFQFSVIIDTNKEQCPERISLTTYKNTQNVIDLINTGRSQSAG